MRSGDRSGTTMLEVMVAAAILSVALLAVVALRAASVRHVTVSEHQLEAQLLARQVIAQLVARPYRQLLDATALPGDDPSLHPVPIPAGFGGDYAATVDGADDAPKPRLLRVAVTVRWSSGGPSSGVRSPASFTLVRLVTMPQYGFVQRLALPHG